MQRRSLLAVMPALLLLCLLVPVRAHAHTPHVCPSSVIDIPGMENSGHTAQSDLVAGLLSTDEVFTRGGALAESRFNACDGQGRPGSTGGGGTADLGSKRSPTQPLVIRTSGPEGTSCIGCHMQPLAGGAGDFVANTFNGAEALDPVTTSIDASVANERNTRTMFGAGYTELLAREMTADLQAFKTANKNLGYTGCKTTVTHGVSFKVCFSAGNVTSASGIDLDLILKPFGAGGTKVSIRQFTVGAFNRHHGMQAEEAYDQYLGDPDFDGDGITQELSVGDITVTTMWQAMLSMPYLALSSDSVVRSQQTTGQQTFNRIGCNICHVNNLTLNNRTFCEPNPYNPPQIFHDTTKSYCVVLNYVPNDVDKTDTGNPNAPPANQPLSLPVFTDLKRHRMCDDASKVSNPIRTLCNEKLTEGRPSQDGYPGTEFFMTPALWGSAESGPYGHNGRFQSYSTIIFAHAGEARAARDAYAALSANDQLYLQEFLHAMLISNQAIRLPTPVTPTLTGTTPGTSFSVVRPGALDKNP